MKNLLIVFAVVVFASSALKAENGNSHAVKDADFVADYFPSESKDKYGVIVLTGSAGGKATDTAKRIADMGYPVLSLAYFNNRFDDGVIPDALEMIPLEYFEAPKKWLMNREETRNDGVIVLGLSKGAELALVLATHDAQYKGVIAVGPSAVVWAGIPRDRSTLTSASSSWSVKGKPLAFVPYIPREGLMMAGLNKFIDWHTASLINAKAVEKALIKVEKIQSPILLLSGGQDLSWPANRMAAAVCKRANSIKNEALCTHVNYENSGHMLGSNREFNVGSDAGVAAHKEIANFLSSLNQ